MKSVVCICDKNINYLQLVQKYLLMKKLNGIDIRVYSELEKLIEESKRNEVDICLLNEEFIKDYKESLSEIKTKKLFILQEDKQHSFDYPAIYKYQQMDKILEIIFDEMPPADNDGEIRFNKTKIITFFETNVLNNKLSGFQISKHLVNLGNKVLYLNFSAFVKFDFLANSVGYDVSDLIFYLLKDTGNISKKIELIKREKDGVDFFLPVQDYQDVLELTATDWEKILNSLQKLEEYDVIVIESSSSNRGLMEIYDKSVTFYMNELDEGKNLFMDILNKNHADTGKLKSYAELDFDYWKGKLKADGCRCS